MGIVAVSYTHLSTGGNEGGDGEYSGTLTIWEGDPTRAVCGDAYKAYFAEKYPNLEIKMETKTENTYQSALSSAFGANQGPDVFWNWGTKNGILESIVAEDLSLIHIFPSYLPFLSLFSF